MIYHSYLRLIAIEYLSIGVKEAEEVTEGLEMNDDTRPRAANGRRRLSRSACKI